MRDNATTFDYKDLLAYDQIDAIKSFIAQLTQYIRLQSISYNTVGVCVNVYACVCLCIRLCVSV